MTKAQQLKAKLDELRNGNIANKRLCEKIDQIQRIIKHRGETYSLKQELIQLQELYEIHAKQYSVKKVYEIANSIELDADTFTCFIEFYSGASVHEVALTYYWSDRSVEYKLANARYELINAGYVFGGCDENEAENDN